MMSELVNRVMGSNSTCRPRVCHRLKGDRAYGGVGDAEPDGTELVLVQILLDRGDQRDSQAGPGAVVQCGPFALTQVLAPGLEVGALLEAVELQVGVRCSRVDYDLALIAATGRRRWWRAPPLGGGARIPAATIEPTRRGFAAGVGSARCRETRSCVTPAEPVTRFGVELSRLVERLFQAVYALTASALRAHGSPAAAVVTAYMTARAATRRRTGAVDDNG